jgi:hypothetical protein
MPKEALIPDAEEAVIGDGEAVAAGMVTFDAGGTTEPVEYGGTTAATGEEAAGEELAAAGTVTVENALLEGPIIVNTLAWRRMDCSKLTAADGHGVDGG